MEVLVVVFVLLGFSKLIRFSEWQATQSCRSETQPAMKPALERA